MIMSLSMTSGSCPGFLGHSQERGSLLLLPVILLSDLQSIGMTKNYSHTKKCQAIFRNDVTMRIRILRNFAKID